MTRHLSQIVEPLAAAVPALGRRRPSRFTPCRLSALFNFDGALELPYRQMSAPFTLILSICPVATIADQQEGA